jgi:hypothetical protein
MYRVEGCGFFPRVRGARQWGFTQAVQEISSGKVVVEISADGGISRQDFSLRSG